MKTRQGLRWVSNDVARPDINSVIPKGSESPQEALASHLKWRAQFIIGEPAPTKELTVDELLSAGVIGLYTADISRFY